MTTTPQKYKQTEIGSIPEDWIPLTIGELIRFEGGSQPPLFYFSQTQHENYIRLIQIRDYKTDKYTVYIPEKLARKKCDANDIMIGRYGPPIFQILKGLKGAYNVALIKAIPTEKLNKSYAYHFLKQDSLFSFIEKLSQRSGGQTGVDISELKKYPFPLPNTEKEQTAIATALNDADVLITQLEKLIAKKRQIKQGAMQELLKPKEGWEFKEIDKEIDLLTGFPFPSSGYSKTGIRLLRCSNVKRGVTDWSDEIVQYWDKITPELKPFVLQVGDIVIAMDGSLVGKSFARLKNIDLPALLLQRVARVRSNKIDMGYLKEFICSDIFTKHCDSVKTVSAIPHISPSDIKSFKIPVPPTIEEQIQIAQTLSDMDAEIAGLEQKLDKYRKLKVGMMQNLLTGKIRLV